MELLKMSIAIIFTNLESAVAGVEVAAPALRRAVRGVLAQELGLGHGVHLRGDSGRRHCERKLK